MGEPDDAGTAVTATHGVDTRIVDTEAVPVRAGLPPVFAPDARVLILGSFPGEASLAAAQYYAHPRNQFWPILSALLDEPLAAMPYDARLDRLRARRVALWDVIERCRRAGSLDSAIRDPRANALEDLLARAPGIRAAAFNGKTAGRMEPLLRDLGLRTYVMPSTSPANASLSRQAKLDAWSVLKSDGWL